MMSIHTFLYGLESWGSALKGSYYDLVTHTFIECGYGLGYIQMKYLGKMLPSTSNEM